MQITNRDQRTLDVACPASPSRSPLKTANSGGRSAAGGPVASPPGKMQQQGIQQFCQGPKSEVKPPATSGSGGGQQEDGGSQGRGEGLCGDGGQKRGMHDGDGLGKVAKLMRGGGKLVH